MFYTIYKCMLGELILISDGSYINELLINEGVPKNIVNNNLLDVFIETKCWLDDYFKGLKPNVSSLKLKPKGTIFQNKVWSITKQIPYGNVTTYKDLAIKLNNPNAQRGVGGALGKNPIPIIIPCHRVIGKNNKLTGYTGGLDIKIKLLELEGINCSNI